MFQPLYVAATGLDAFQDEVLNITNNLANAKTTAYKKERTEMESLFYVEKSFKDTLAQAMDQTGAEAIPEFGTGVRIAATSRDFAQGSLQTTNNPFDIAIQGEGFLQFRMPDGSNAYGRAGNLHVDNEGNLVDPNGHLLEPSVVLPQGTTGVTIRQDGTVLVTINNELSQTEIGQINLVKFPNSNGLKSVGQNLFAATSASGDPIMSMPGSDGYGMITQYSLESSNVDVISEMMRMVMVQRVFDTITKAVSTYEGMMTTLERMKA
jgi:flagellar basal-body rod protein FlgG